MNCSELDPSVYKGGLAGCDASNLYIVLCVRPLFPGRCPAQSETRGCWWEDRRGHTYLGKRLRSVAQDSVFSFCSGSRICTDAGMSKGRTHQAGENFLILEI